MHPTVTLLDSLVVYHGWVAGILSGYTQNSNLEAAGSRTGYSLNRIHPFVSKTQSQVSMVAVVRAKSFVILKAHVKIGLSPRGHTFEHKNGTPSDAPAQTSSASILVCRHFGWRLRPALSINLPSRPHDCQSANSP